MSDTESDEPVIIPQRKLIDVSRNDVKHNNDPHDDNIRYYAITVNIQPSKTMNKKQWRTYNEDEQRAILTRIEKSFRTKNPIVKLLEIHFEKCPTLSNIHYHALYIMPFSYANHMYLYFNRICSAKNDATLKEWRFIDIQPLHTGDDISNWIQYIRKDIK